MQNFSLEMKMKVIVAPSKCTEIEEEKYIESICHKGLCIIIIDNPSSGFPLNITRIILKYDQKKRKRKRHLLMHY